MYNYCHLFIIELTQFYDCTSIVEGAVVKNGQCIEYVIYSALQWITRPLLGLNFLKTANIIQI